MNNEDDLTQKDIDEYNERRKKEYDEATKGNEELRKRQEEQKRINDILKERPGEGSLQRRQRISREMGRNYKGRETRTDAEIQSEGNLRGEPTPEEIFKEKTPQEKADAEKGAKEARRVIEQGKKDRGEDYDPKFLESISFETAGNLALDNTTNWLLAAPFPGARPLYAMANVGGSGIINYFAQRIRGTEFSLGELATASGLSLVPGATNVKSAKGIAKAVSRGAVTGGVQVTSESLIDTGKFPDAETLTAGTVMGGSLGGIFQHTANSSDDIRKFLGNIRTRINGGKQLITPDGIPIDASDFEPNTAFAMGGKGSGRKPTPKPDPNQKNIFDAAKEDPSLGQSDEAINEQYQALYKQYDNRTLGDTIDPNLTNKQKREQYSRKLQSTDLDLIIQEEALKGNTVPSEKAQEYVDLVNETRIGKKDRNNPSGRLRRNQKGYIGTMVYLNEVSLGINPNTLGNTADVIKHISKEMGTDPIGLKRIIEGQGGEISFQTEGMTTPKKIRSLKELVEAYHLRLSRYKDIPAFEKGHVFAANNIIEDRNINSLTDFKDNLEPEISRSIREQLDDEAIEELIKAKGTLKGDDFYRSILDGNRKRQNKQDPDKILADLLGTQYGLRESFLTFVNPERSLSNIIPVESKAAFAELYRKELLAEIKGLKADLKNSGQSSIGPATIDQLKLDVARSVAKGMKNNKILEEVILMDDMISKRGMTEQGQAKPLPDDPIKREPDGTIKGDTPD